ncbi:hypothetical protein C7212DRAFT_341057 [Tuber magnatum]|uniref:Uncharacterized protein n=1 Tax=Tuber magnatum TaxID=42249 RepID=A0A317T001_9PEZI|nr:hypothetical protein C7212DRAFT_341057 [Tuber magnatum]
MPQYAVKKSSSLVPLRDQPRLMCKALGGLEADPAILIGITPAGAYAASSRSPNRVTFKSGDTVASSPVSDPKTGQYNNGSEKPWNRAGITSDLWSGNLNATSIAAPPAGAPPAGTQEPCSTRLRAATKEAEKASSDQQCSPPVANVDASYTSSQTKESYQPISFLGPRNFPKGPDGKERRWRQLQDNYPALSHLGTPTRSTIEREGHTGQLKPAPTFNGEWKPYPLTPEELALRDQRERQEKSRLALWNSGAFGKRAAALRRRTAALKLSTAQPPSAPATAAPSTPKAVAPAPTREEFRDQVANWRRSAEKLKAQLLDRLR